MVSGSSKKKLIIVSFIDFDYPYWASNVQGSTGCARIMLRSAKLFILEKQLTQNDVLWIFYYEKISYKIKCDTCAI